MRLLARGRRLRRALRPSRFWVLLLSVRPASRERSCIKGFNHRAGLAAALALALTLGGCSSAAYRWQSSTYTVRSGDTLYGIAFDHDLDFHKLARWNAIHAPYTIYVGQTLRLKPPGSAKPPRAVAARAVKHRSSAASDSRSSRAHQSAPAPSGKRIAGDWVWPVKGPLLSLSGPAVTPRGLDIGGHVGEPVHAAATGHVVYSGDGLKGYGLLVIIKHNSHYLSAYAHNSKLEVKEGERVRSGQEIARMGLGPQQTPMLHFEIRRDGQPIDPQTLLPGRNAQ